jgi:hypothetical protein
MSTVVLRRLFYNEMLFNLDNDFKVINLGGMYLVVSSQKGD